MPGNLSYVILAIGIEAEALNSIFGLIFKLARQLRLSTQQLGVIRGVRLKFVHVNNKLGGLGVFFLSSVGFIHYRAKQVRLDRLPTGRLQATPQTRKRNYQHTD